MGHANLTFLATPMVLLVGPTLWFRLIGLPIKFVPTFMILRELILRTSDDPLTFHIVPAGQNLNVPRKSLNIYQIYWETIWYRHSQCPEDESEHPDFFFGTTGKFIFMV